jgi:hypothetical protein
VGPSFPPQSCPCLEKNVSKTFISHGGSFISVRECDAQDELGVPARRALREHDYDLTIE